MATQHDDRTVAERLRTAELQTLRHEIELWVERGFVESDLTGHARWHLEQNLREITERMDRRALWAGVVRGVIIACAVLAAGGVLLVFTVWGAR